jgi:two-component system sensor histidine kinase RegB
LIGVALLFDITSLTAMLMLSGGFYNPFSIYYFANLALAAVVYPGRQVWYLTAYCCLCIVLTFLIYIPIPELIVAASSEVRNLWWPGKLTAFLTAAPMIVYFTSKVADELIRTESELFQSQQRQARMEKLQALGTLAAGAAHELASPLSTIAVVAKELALSLQQGRLSEGSVEDAQLIREEVARCRTILQQMAADAGQHAGEGLQRISAAQLVPNIIDGCRNPARVRATIDADVEEIQVFAPRHLLAQSLRGLVNNALDASREDSSVDLLVKRANGHLLVQVRDVGHGMMPNVLARAGEPFFTTKEVGKGMGLGLFLARTVVERLEGELKLESHPNGGTLATVRLPIAPD